MFDQELQLALEMSAVAEEEGGPPVLEHAAIVQSPAPGYSPPGCSPPPLQLEEKENAVVQGVKVGESNVVADNGKQTILYRTS